MLINSIFIGKKIRIVYMAREGRGEYEEFGICRGLEGGQPILVCEDLRTQKIKLVPLFHVKEILIES